MHEPFTTRLHARWGEIDTNGHMRNTAYLDVAADVRMLFFAAHGFPIREFARVGVGPVILQDTLDYHRELRLLDPYDVSLTLLGSSQDGSRWRMRNAFTREDGKPVATVTSHGAWLDLSTRRVTPPPAALMAALDAMPRHPDFAELVAQRRE